MELGPSSGWDEETRNLVDEVEGAKVLWGVLAVSIHRHFV